MLGARIAMLRRRQNMSQKELAVRMGIRPSTVGMYEQGRREPDCEGLVKLAEIFDVSTDFLLTGAAAEKKDLEALRGIWKAAQKQLDGRLVLRAQDGSERPFGEEELALLLAALLGGEIDGAERI